MGIRYSKNGLIKFIEDLFKKECKNNKNDVKNAKLWEQKLEIPGLNMYMKKGGSHLSVDQPYIRNDITFKKNYKMEKVLDCIYNPDHVINWDQNVEKASLIKPPMGRTYGINYLKQKR